MTTFCIVAGEASGDKQAALLVKQLLDDNQLPRVENSSHNKATAHRFWGIAGPDMRAVGVEAFLKTEDLAVMGFVEVVSHYFEISNIYKKLLEEIRRQKPDVLIVVDYPGFNMRLIADVFPLGVKIFYHIPPKVWAHGAGRIENLAAHTHLVTCVLPFEEDFLRQNGVVAKFIGNPLFDACEDSLKQHLQKNVSTEPLTESSLARIGLCPGSRKNEIEHILPVLIESFAALVKVLPNATAVIPVARTLDKYWLQKKVNELCPQSTVSKISLSTEPFVDVVASCDYAWVCSGTATLETAFLQVPHSIVYKLNELSFFIAKQIADIPYVGLANWCAGKMVVPEFLQGDAKPENLVAHACVLLLNRHERLNFFNRMTMVRNKFSYGAAVRAADMMKRALHLYDGSEFEQNWLRTSILRENWL